MTQFKFFAALMLTLTFTATTMQGMEQLQLFENKRPTIKAEIWFKPNKSAFYLTQASIDHLTSKSITAPIIPIGLKIDRVKVIEPNGLTVTNWKHGVPALVRSYEEQQLRKRNLPFAQLLAGSLAVDNLTFPKRLPAELALHCSNGTKICLTIHGFPVEATFESNGIFHEEYEKAMTNFFDHPCSSLSSKEKFILIQKNIMSGPKTTDETLAIMFFNLMAGTPDRCPFGHGFNGCSNKERFLELIKNNKIQSCLTPKHKNTTALLLNRQTGLVRKEPRTQSCQYQNALMVSLLPFAIKRPQTMPRHRSKCEQVDAESKLFIDQRDQPLLTISEEAAINSDRILEECLAEMEVDKILDECFDEFQASNQEVVEPTHVRELYSRNKDQYRHGNECILL